MRAHLCYVNISPSDDDIGRPAIDLFCNRSDHRLTHNRSLCSTDNHQLNSHRARMHYRDSHGGRLRGGMVVESE